MHKIDNLLIVAGPTAAGKSTLLDNLVKADPRVIRERLGVENLRDWPRIGANRLIKLNDLQESRVILHFDFLWAPENSRATPSVGNRLPALTCGASEISLVTLWTSAGRLERQLVEGKLRTALTPGWGEKLKAALFRLLPHVSIRPLAAIMPLESLNRLLPGRQLIHHLLLVRIYSRREGVIELYRRWLELCDTEGSGIRNHCFLEFDRELKFYSRAEWEARVLKEDDIK
jgi:hypothetical protein